MNGLTAKQQGVCDLVVLGWSSKEIAAKIGIDYRTVEAHRSAIFRKMGVRNAVELVRKLFSETGASQNG
jgi:DNA-binding NarL/FixJ family response regulator